MTRDQEAICALTGEVERLRTERDVMISVVAAACERVERAEARLAEAVALLREIVAWRVAIECVAPELGGVATTLSRIDAFLAKLGDKP